MRRALIAVGLAGVVYLAAFHVPPLRDADAWVLRGFTNRWDLPGALQAEYFVPLFDPIPYVLLGLWIVGAAAVAGRVRAGLVAAAMMVGAVLATQALQALLAAPRDVATVEADAWPSGHAAAATAFAFALAIVAPPWLRPYAIALGAVLVALVSVAILLIGSHYPSDLVGGVLVAAAISGSALAPTAARLRRRPDSPRARG